MPNIDVILVSQGLEYQAVCRGLRPIVAPKPQVIPIPMSPQPVTQYLQKWQSHKSSTYHLSHVLMLGLCGSLSPQYNRGEVVIYKNCLYSPQGSNILVKNCDFSLTTLLAQKLNFQKDWVTGFTSDRMIASTQEKHQIHKNYQADVVDMEGFATLEILNKANISVAMIRVVSDDCHQNIPNLNSALNSQGILQPFPLATAMMQKPIASFYLIRGALQGLKILQKITTNLFIS